MFSLTGVLERGREVVCVFVCVFVCVCERERKCAIVRGWMDMCAHVCVCERERTFFTLRPRDLNIQVM